jgi:nucleotide-binding universal stress UspA family protein/nitrite reductase/ring-hydroxylating ferredoxin subunit
VAYGTVVVGTDGSPTARIAERAAARVARLAGGRLLIVSAYTDAAGEKEADRVLAESEKLAANAGAAAEPMPVEGEPAWAIRYVADQLKADLIVVGDVGMGGPKRFGLGGVADRLSHDMPCDMLIVRTSRWTEGMVPAAYQNALIATDGSPTADRAARVGTEFAVMMEAGVTLVQVGDRVLGKILLRDTAERLGDVDLPVRVLKGGDAGEKISKLAGDEGHDLVVIGNRGMSGSKRFIAGTVPNKISHLAPCDVLIVNTAERGVDDLDRGEGALVTADGRRIAAYRAEDGELVTLSPACKHLGCTVGWNDGAKTWDCPCHGSRYDARGKVIQGPAEKDLDPVELASAP